VHRGSAPQKLRIAEAVLTCGDLSCTFTKRKDHEGIAVDSFHVSELRIPFDDVFPTPVYPALELSARYLRGLAIPTTVPW
jgi:hypothetical protein